MAWRSKEAWEGALATLTADIAQHPQLGQSQPPLDVDFLAEVAAQYEIAAIRQQLNLIHLWIKAGNRRENYQATLLAFLKNSSWATCPKCNHKFKIK